MVRFELVFESPVEMFMVRSRSGCHVIKGTTWGW